MPTRSLPESSDLPHPFAHAPGERVDQVLGSYRDAATASTRATAAVAEIAAAIRAPSQVLTAARAAVQSGAGLDATERPPAAEPARVRRWTRNIAGPVERTLQDLGVTSPPVLLRAAAIDKAGEQIILDNGPAASPHGRHSVPADLSRSTGTTELINHMLATGHPRVAAILRPPAPIRPAEAEAEP